MDKNAKNVSIVGISVRQKIRCLIRSSTCAVYKINSIGPSSIVCGRQNYTIHRLDIMTDVWTLTLRVVV